MANQPQKNRHQDRVLMQMCRKAARKRGLDPDEPSFKAYCTRLYNQTMQGKGLADYVSDADAEANAKRLTDLFKAINFPFKVSAEGKFIDFYGKSSNAWVDIDDVASAFR